MFAWLKQRNTPIRIKSLKELEYGFKPKWHRYLVRLELAGMIMASTILGAAQFNIQWLSWISICGFASISLLIAIPPLLRFVAYYSPWLGLKSVQLDSWLELDLDWKR